MLVLAALVLSLSSCQKMALQHTCTCTLQRVVNGQPEDLGTISEKQIGSYQTARDTCDKLQDDYTYDRKTNGVTENHTATCEID